jgi:hypothetical protein
MDTPSADRIREAYLNREPGRELLLARAALHNASCVAAEVLGQTPTSLDSFCQIIHQLDAISEKLKATAQLMKWTDLLTVTSAEKSDEATSSN